MFWRPYSHAQVYILEILESSHRRTSPLVVTGYLVYFVMFPSQKYWMILTDLQGGQDYVTRLVQTSSKEDMPWSSSPLIVSRDSFSLLTWASFQTTENSLLWRMSLYIFDNYAVFITLHVCVIILMASLSLFIWLLVLGLYKEGYLQLFRCVSVWFHSFFRFVGRFWSRKPV